MVEAMAEGVPVEPLARYFEYWLLRLQGVYPRSPMPRLWRWRWTVPGGGAYLAPGAECSRVPACAPAAQVREPHLSRAALAFLRAARRTPPREVGDAAGDGRRRSPSSSRSTALLMGRHLERELKSTRVLREMRRAAARDAAAGSGSEAMTFQDLILKLSEFWASRGCVLQQPLDVEVGAGTMHPETFLRVLGPAHWNVAYVQPSRRPADGRFGENPNRLFKHHQFQVILKPAPDEVQQLYLESLEACGINPRQHDIRFEEDNWESPTLGAWGIGWQVMFDGLEITQFTYFQQAGGIELAPISARADLRPRAHRDGAAARRQRLRHRVGARREVRRRAAARGSRAVEVRLRPGRHARATSSARSTATCSTGTTRSASALLTAGLIWPALEHCLKCSHLFNILDSSNSIGVTERTAYILRVRQLAVGIAKAYVEGRRRPARPMTAADAGRRRARRSRIDGSRAAARNRRARSCRRAGCRR